MKEIADENDANFSYLCFWNLYYLNAGESDILDSTISNI